MNALVICDGEAITIWLDPSRSTEETIKTIRRMSKENNPDGKTEMEGDRIVVRIRYDRLLIREAVDMGIKTIGFEAE
jgi:hypothetical protein